jgi:hypothetical protein
MAGLPKKYFKKFPGQLKKAWAAYRADKGGKTKHKKAPKKKAHKKAHKAKKTIYRVVAKKHYAKKAPSKERKGSTMAKHKKRYHKVKSAVSAGMGSRPGQILAAAGMAAAGGVVTSYAINSIPKVKDMSAITKSSAQLALGLAAIFLGKKKWIKGLGAGAAIAAVFGATKAILKVDPLAGPSSTPTLSPAQMARLTSGKLAIPAPVVRMNVPSAVSMRGRAPVSGWTSGGWGNNW